VPWLSITLETEGERAQALADALAEAGALAVALEDAAPGSAAAERGAQPIAPGAWPRTRLVALAEAGADARALVAHASARCGIAAPEIATARLEDEDWVRCAQAQFGPQQVGRRLWVVPSWCEAPDPRALNLRIDPGLAFGTGEHPSTRLVLAWLEANVEGGERLLDYGCGSGVLAIAALRLGARAAVAVDVDPAALAVAAANARANGVALQTVAPQALAAGHPPFDLVVANILAGTLVALAAELAARTRPGGRIALSGILAAQAQEVIPAYTPHFDCALCASEEDWVLVAGRRR